MTNKHNGEVAVTINDQEYSLKLTAQIFAAAEGLLGIDSLIGKALGFRSIQALFFLACQGQNGIKTIDDVGELMNTHMQPMASAVTEAIDFFYQQQHSALTPGESQAE